MTGDMVDDRRKDAPARELFSYVQSLGIPAYCVCGNHETYISDLSGTLDMIRSYGIRPLDGESEEITVRGVPMLICGISDPRKYSRKGYEEVAKKLKRAFPNFKTVAITLRRSISASDNIPPNADSTFSPPRMPVSQ